MSMATIVWKESGLVILPNKIHVHMIYVFEFQQQLPVCPSILKLVETSEYYIHGR